MVCSSLAAPCDQMHVYKIYPHPGMGVHATSWFLKFVVLRLSERTIAHIK
jgi:hypothetical protein